LLTDDDFRLIAALPKLRYLTLVGAHEISDQALRQFRENHTLQQLCFSGTKTTVDVLEHLEGLKKLRLLELNLWQADAHGRYGPLSADKTTKARKALERLKNLPSLEAVRLRGNVFVDEVMQVLADFQNLRQIGYDDRFVHRETIDLLKASLPACEIKSQGFNDETNLDY
jgi:hypothetical protein